MLLFIGELAALGTSLCFTVGSVFFTKASRLVGAMVLNRTRLLVAFGLLSLSHLVVLGSLYPVDAGPQRWFWLGASGVVGLALGDIFLFNGFAWIGPRLTLLVMSTAPILSAILAWLFLGETLNLLQVAGIAITLSGIGLVVMVRNGDTGSAVQHGRYLPGVLAALGASVCQAVGLVLARNGLGGDFSAISGNFIRMISAAVAIWLFTLVQRQGRQTVDTLRQHPRAGLFIFIGALMGPFLGVSLSLFALQHTEVGVASTLTSLPPVFLLPVSYFVFHERYGWQAIAGTLVAIAGSVMLMLV